MFGCSDQRENDARLGVDADSRDQHSRTSFHNVGAWTGESQLGTRLTKIFSGFAHQTTALGPWFLLYWRGPIHPWATTRPFSCHCLWWWCRRRATDLHTSPERNLFDLNENSVVIKARIIYLAHIADHDVSHRDLNDLATPKYCIFVLSLDSALETSELPLLRPIVESCDQDNDDDWHKNGQTFNPPMVLFSWRRFWNLFCLFSDKFLLYVCRCWWPKSKAMPWNNGFECFASLHTKTSKWSKIVPSTNNFLRYHTLCSVELIGSFYRPRCWSVTEIFK